MAVTTLIAGDFGRLHAGHLDHIMKAYALGDWLIIATHTDEGIKARKGYEPIPLWARVIFLRSILSLLGGAGEVVLAKDTDGLVAKTLTHYHPDIFAKGGGYNEDNMPKREKEVCKRLGIKIVYGVGERLNQSRDLKDSN